MAAHKTTGKNTALRISEAPGPRLPRRLLPPWTRVWRLIINSLQNDRLLRARRHAPRRHRRVLPGWLTVSGPASPCVG